MMRRADLRACAMNPRRWCFAAIVVATVVAAIAAQQYLPNSVVAADESAPPKAFKEKDTQIVPVLCVFPGEKKECVLSTECTVGLTRGGGLSIREMGDPAFPLNDMKKTWTKAGLTLTVPDFGEAIKVAASPQFATLKEKGLDAFIVTAEASKDATEGMYEIHLADSTCSGHCRTTLRVVVHRPQ